MIMLPSNEAWWKAVIAEVDSPVAETQARLRAAAETCGFHSRGVRNDGESFLHSELLLLIHTRYEWRIEVNACPDQGSEFSIRVGFAPGLGYYGTLILIFAAAIFAGPMVISYPGLGAAPLVVMGVLMILPIAHSIVLRLRARHFERRLWRELACLGPWRNSRIVLRSLNQAYGEDRIIPGRDLSREAMERR